MNYRKVRFEYYQVVFRRRNDRQPDRDRLFDLPQWMDILGRKSLEAKTYDYRQEQARLESSYWDVELGFYFLHFVRLRDTNIPSTARQDGQVVPLELEDDEYIGEEVSALYDENNHVLMLQRNKYSLGPEGIEEYLNLLWNNDEETIYLRPICPPNIFELARRSAEYRKINIRFADLRQVNKGNILERFKSPVRQMIDSFKKYQGANVQITITVGNSRTSALDDETVSDTLNDIEENPEFFSRAELAVKEDDDSRIELIDLFAHKAHDFGTFRMERRETLSHQAIAAEMWRIYSANEDCYNRQRDVNRYLRDKEG
ncbi:hypothetical protein M5W68_20580 [Paenibacillus larvae]|uniref:DUF6731 family protein n=1 Tax=Paenibacillus larvae TaxID=1464 RepID=UPI0022808EEE|nr:DUF6731 family protein [Paenibacillus larvae]MCY9508548.1 hypothetical protein [Paenibacillus larvae]MCY9527425.1 hypothetical protein [Paenibacillus larvae]